jgi:glyoxylase-like metal-dependent hydrolase (beta-lactamase superfamily II)
LSNPPIKFKDTALNIHHFSVGNIKLMVVSDGLETLNEEGLVGMVKSMPDDFLQAFRDLPQPYHFSFNVVYLESAGERILIDVGHGAQHQPQFGHVLDLLGQEGITPQQIDKIIASHFHLDHIGGLTADGSAVFPNAELIVPKREWEYAIESGNVPAERVQILKDLFQPYTDRIRYVDEGETVAEGVTVVALPGHTAGHCGFMIESQGERLLDLVDALHLQMQIAYPDVSPVYDFQPDVSAQSRRKALDRIADEGLMALTYHLPFPGLGRIERDGTGFTWKPVQ